MKAPTYFTHRWCRYTGMCERCGLPLDHFQGHLKTPCHNGHNVFSLDWWRELKAWSNEMEGFIAEIEKELKGEI